MSKKAQNPQFLTLLTWKCASCHSSVHFFDIATSKSGPRMVCFVHFDLEMCFAPQRRALFRHRNFQKWSEHGVFCTFWLGNVLRATTACTFWTSQLPKVLGDRQLLTLFTSKCASRNNAVHFFDIATSKSGPIPWCFVHFDLETCFAPPQCFATFLPFCAPASSFFWSFLFWLFSPLLFNCPYCRKFHF